MASSVNRRTTKGGRIILLPNRYNRTAVDRFAYGCRQPSQDGVEESVGSGGDGFLLDDGSFVVENAQGEGSGMEIDAAVESVLLVVESHHGLRVKSYLSLVTSRMLNAKRP